MPGARSLERVYSAISSRRFWAHVFLKQLPQIIFFFGEPIFSLLGKRYEGSKDILIVRLDFAGDLVLTSSFVRELRKNYPTHTISLVVPAEIYSLAEFCPHVDRIYSVEFNDPKRILKNITALLTLFARHLWREKIETTFLFGSGWHYYYAALTAYLSGAKNRIGYSGTLDLENAAINRSLNCLLTQAVCDSTVRHENERNLKLITQQGGVVSETKPELWLTRKDDEEAKQILISHGIDLQVPIIAFCPGAREPKRIWPAVRYAEIGRKLIRDGLQIVVLGNAAEEYLTEKIVRNLGPRAVQLAGKTTLRQLAAALHLSRFCVGSDSASIHMAAALGVPVAVISCHPKTGGPNHLNAPEKYGPVTEFYTMIRPETARFPCIDGCESVEAHCIEQINLETVMGKISELLESQILKAEAL